MNIRTRDARYVNSINQSFKQTINLTAPHLVGVVGVVQRMSATTARDCSVRLSFPPIK